MQEAVLRAAGPTMQLAYFCYAVDMFVIRLVSVVEKDHLTTEAAIAHTSLVTTLVKLLQVHTHPAPPDLADDDVPHEQLTLAAATGQYISLAYALNAVLFRPVSTGPSVVMHFGPDAVQSAMRGCLTDSTNGNLLAAQLDRDARCLLSRALHRLSAVLTVGLVRLSNWRLKRGGSIRMADTVPQWLRDLSQSHQHADMGALAQQLTDPLSRAGKFVSEMAFNKLEARVWEEYALEHFEGRLMPGCCNLGCTRLEGFSEASMPTLLCSGCRRARYCSVACQKAGWAAGGHAKVCSGKMKKFKITRV